MVKNIDSYMYDVKKRNCCILTIILMSAVVFNSCVDTINSTDLVWQPYLINDKVVFQSNCNQIEVYTISNIEIFTNPNDHLAIITRFNQILFVEIQNINNNHIKTLLSLKKYNKKLYVDLCFRPGDFTRYTPTYIVGVYLDKVIFNGISVYKIYASDFFSNDYKSENINDLDYILWSDMFGYIGLFYKNSNYWLLTDFVRNNQSIYQCDINLFNTSSHND